MTGTSLVAISVGQSAFIAHGLKKHEPDPEKQFEMRQHLENARLITMLNGLGLCLISIKGKGRLSIVPFSLLTVGTGAFSGLIFYSKIYKDDKLNFLVKYGGSATIFGWFAMALM